MQIINKKLIAQLALLFFITQAIGLATGDFLINEDIHATMINEDPDSIDNSIFLIGYILVFTAILLAVLKFAPEWLFYIFLKGIESLAILGTTAIVLSAFITEGIVVLVLAVIMVGLRIFLSKNIWLRNVSSVFATAGAGALIGASLGVLPIIVFIVLLSVYDLIAVFKTKHMVTLAKGVTKKNLSFTFALPTKDHQFELGTGDMVIPLAFAVSVLGSVKQTGIQNVFMIPSLILFGSLIGLIVTVHWASQKNGKALPALPLQTLLMIIVYVVASIL